jgi:hypothetical protein
MAGKKIKSFVVENFIEIQDTSEFPTGFPIYCAVITDNNDEGKFWSEQLFHEKDNVIILPSNTDWQQLAVLSGMFTSRGDAKRNNFNGEIKEGYHEVTSGKGFGQKFVFVYKDIVT